MENVNNIIFLIDSLVLRENQLTFWNFLLVFFSVCVYLKWDNAVYIYSLIGFFSILNILLT